VHEQERIEKRFPWPCSLKFNNHDLLAHRYRKKSDTSQAFRAVRVRIVREENVQFWGSGTRRKKYGE